MVTTRTMTTPNPSFDYCCLKLMSFGAQHPVRAGLIAAGYNTPYDLAMIVDHDLDMITYEKVDDNGNIINPTAPLLPAHRGIIRMFARFLRAKQNVKGEILTESELLALTNKDFDYYRTMDKLEPNPNYVNANVNIANTTTTTFNEADTFIKGCLATTKVPVGAPISVPTKVPICALPNKPYKAPTSAPTMAPIGTPMMAPVSVPTVAPFSAPTTASIKLAPVAAPVKTPVMTCAVASVMTSTVVPVTTPIMEPIVPTVCSTSPLGATIPYKMYISGNVVEYHETVRVFAIDDNVNFTSTSVSIKGDLIVNVNLKAMSGTVPLMLPLLVKVGSVMLLDMIIQLPVAYKWFKYKEPKSPRSQRFKISPSQRYSCFTY
jgi:hypothetical protein